MQDDAITIFLSNVFLLFIVQVKLYKYAQAPSMLNIISLKGCAHLEAPVLHLIVIK